MLGAFLRPEIMPIKIIPDIPPDGEVVAADSDQAAEQFPFGYVAPNYQPPSVLKSKKFNYGLLYGGGVVGQGLADAPDSMPQATLKTNKKVLSKEPPIELNEAAKTANPWQPVESLAHFMQLRQQGIQIGIYDFGEYSPLRAHEKYTDAWIEGHIPHLGFNKKYRSRVVVMALCKETNFEGMPIHVIRTLSFNDMKDWQQIKQQAGYLSHVGIGLQTIHFAEGTIVNV